MEREIEKLADDAEHQSRCIAPTTRPLQRALKLRSNRGTMTIVHPGLYDRRHHWKALTTEERYLHVLRALSIKHPTWVFCGISAGVVHHLVTSHRLMTEIYVATSVQSHIRNTESFRRRVIELRNPVRKDGVTVTSPIQTAFDCLRELDFVQGLPVADAMCKMTVGGRTAVIEGFRAFVHKRRYRKAVHQMMWADSASENAGESMIRAAIILAGFAIPKLQEEFRDPVEPHRVIRVDFLWQLSDGQSIIGEFDGRVKYHDPTMMGGHSEQVVKDNERLRESRLTLLADRVIRFHYEDIFDQPRLIKLLNTYGIPRRHSGIRRSH